MGTPKLVSSRPESASLTLSPAKPGFHSAPTLRPPRQPSRSKLPAQAILCNTSAKTSPTGLQTFIQLVRITPEGFSAPVVTIDDQPRFQWRGLMIDSGRHFMPIDV